MINENNRNLLLQENIEVVEFTGPKLVSYKKSLQKLKA
jgi:hypothetical protein